MTDYNSFSYNKENMLQDVSLVTSILHKLYYEPNSIMNKLKRKKIVFS